MDKDFLFETNRHSDFAASVHASETYEKDRSADRKSAAHDPAQTNLPMVEFGSGWYHQDALNPARKS